MSKYVLFSVLLITLNVSAQEILPVKVQATQQLKWDEQEPYINGFARVLKNNHFSFINKAGNLVTPAEFDGARNFSNHLAAVQKNNKWGFIDETGKVIVPLQYDIVFDFKAPVTGVFGNKRWWLINNQATVVKALDITTFYGFKNGVANIDKNGRTGTINTNGEITFNKEQAAPLIKSPVPYHTSTNALTSSITACPDNIDFEYGSFFNWQCFTGHVDSIGTTNVITLLPSPPTPNRHTLYNRIMPSAIDPFGLFPTNPPDGSNFALKLGNTKIGGEAEGVTYTIHVPINDSNFSIKYDYAVVFQNPNHTLWAQPRFQVKVFDSAANAYVDCASFEYVSTANLPGFAVSTVDTSVIYKPWSTVFLSLRGYAGKTMYLEFKNADCVRKGHWGYSYVDVEKPCGQSIEMDYDCAPPHITTLNAPPGFQTYNWWDSAFTTILATGQNAVLNPGPVVNTTIWLEMIPFNNFGCLDTISVKITGEFKAHFDQSDTLGLCAPHTFTFYNRDIPSVSAIWDFGDGTTGTGDTVTHTYASTGSYIVKLNVELPGGCKGVVQKLVSVVQPRGSFSFTGGNLCGAQTVRFDAITSNADSLFWNFGDGTVLHTKLDTVTHTYNTAGKFIPSLIIHSVGGCQTPVPVYDTVSIEILQPGFTNTLVKVCGSTTLNLKDTSRSFFGIISRQWDFGDGTTGTGTMVSHTYTTTGIYNVRLIITGTTGCMDTVIKPINIKVNDAPIAAIVGDTVDCQGVSVTFSGVVTSVDPITYNHWTCTNGIAGSGTSFLVNFPLAGTFTIQLITGTANGCYDTATHTILIKPRPDVLQPPSQVLCNGSMAAATFFTGAVPGTIYSWTNTWPAIGLPASGIGDIAPFPASSNGSSVANASIRVTPVANGCTGPYKTFIFTVYPTPNVVQPADQTLCDNSNTAPINFNGTVAGTTYDWTNNNTSIGLGASGTGNIPSFTANSNGATSNTAIITVTPIANGCPGTPKTLTITVNPMPDVVQPNDQQLCSGTLTTAINFSGPVAGTMYTWTNTNTVIGLAANGTGNIAAFTAQSNGASIATATITVTPSINGCTAPPKSFVITVDPTPAVVQPADQTLCDNSTTTAINFTGTVTGATYNWTNNNPTIGLPASGTGNIPSFTANSNGATSNTATITVTPTSNGCPGTPKTFIITVKPMPDVVQPNDQQLCSGTLTTAINFSGPVAGTMYTWTNTNTVIGLAANGTGNIAAFTAQSNGASIATATITVTPSINGCTAPPKSFVITVDPTPSVVQPTDQTLCDNSTTTAINFTGAVTGTTYNWTNSNPTIGLAASGTGNIPSFTANSNGATSNTATITVTPTINGCPGTPKTFIITVKPMPDVVQPNNQVLCTGSNTSAINFTGPVAGTIYSWTNTAPLIGLAANGTGNIPSFQAFSNGASVATATITVTASANGCAAPPKTFVITVNPIPTIVQPASQAVCNGAIINPITFAGNIPGAIYTWTNNNTAIGLPATGAGDINSFTAVNNSAVAITATITVLPTTSNCAGVGKVFNITINPTPSVVAKNSTTVCLGSTVQLNATGAAQYVWAPVDHLTCSNCANPVSKPVDSIMYTVKGTSALGCDAYDSVLLSVIKPFRMQVTPNDTLCIGATTSLGAFKANSYLWSPPTGLSRVNIANPTARPSVTTRYQVIGFDGYNCFTDTGYVVITVGPRPTVNLGPDRVLATGTPLTINAVTTNGPIINYAWSPVSELSCNNCPSPSTVVKNNSFYTVEVTNTYGCKAIDTLIINSICKSAQVFIPNAFTPDGDGLNDILMIRGRGVTIKSFRIFNRWGEIVFEKENFYPDDPKFGWDGRVKGIPATPDVFVYTCEVFCDNGIPFTYKGNITILK